MGGNGNVLRGSDWPVGAVEVLVLLVACTLRQLCILGQRHKSRELCSLAKLFCAAKNVYAAKNMMVQFFLKWENGSELTETEGRQTEYVLKMKQGSIKLEILRSAVKMFSSITMQF